MQIENKMYESNAVDLHYFCSTLQRPSLPIPLTDMPPSLMIRTWLWDYSQQRGLLNMRMGNTSDVLIQMRVQVYVLIAFEYDWF